MRKENAFVCVVGFTSMMVGCSSEYNAEMIAPEASIVDIENEEGERHSDVDESEENDASDYDTEEYAGGYNGNIYCNGNFLSAEGVEEMLFLTELTDSEDIYSTYARIDGVASLFEACGDPWGLFPTTYRHITNRGIEAVEDGEFENPDWGRHIIIDFASRYMKNLRAALLTDEEPSWAWKHYYDLADREDVSKTRAVIVAMCAHLMLDLPYSLADIGSTEDHKNDFFVFGELMIEVAEDLNDDLIRFYGTDAGPLLNGFFLGEWIDGRFGSQTTITLSYQAVRTKSWNNRWYIQQSWGSWVASSEIWSSFWATDGALAVLDASGAID